jgi:hypothetical protein
LRDTLREKEREKERGTHLIYDRVRAVFIERCTYGSVGTFSNVKGREV